ncbi:MAG TPA: acyl-CoA dehydrogenase family protein [Nevskiaceae bacterium]|nr:acyl-CoA dehydrogenase family protein [Nevskiaceae bacterium]
MDFAFTDGDERFLGEIRAFLRDHLPPALASREAQGFHLSRAAIQPWHDAVYRQGWVAPGWPVEFGGTGWSPLQRYLWERECGLANAPELSLIGLSMVGPVLCRFGSEELQRRLLEPIRRGELWFCQGFSEPQAGSDLASLRTRARLEGDEWIVTGQKTWTTSAHEADYMIGLFRTNPDAKPQAGLSMLLVPMHAPGVTVKPIATLDDDHTINEVFLDDVHVPRANLIGEPGEGWTQAKFLLGNERTHNAFIGMLRRHLARIPRLLSGERARGLPDAAAQAFRRKLALLEIDVEALEWSVLRVLSAERGPWLDAAISGLKIRGSEYLLRAADLEMEILGPASTPRFAPGAAVPATPLPAGAPPEAAGRSTQYLYWRASTIFGGTNEIQRGIIWGALFRG